MAINYNTTKVIERTKPIAIDLQLDAEAAAAVPDIGERLRTDDLTMTREVPFPRYQPGSGMVGTHNPLWAEICDSRLIVHLLPDDGYGSIVSYATPLTGMPS